MLFSFLADRRKTTYRIYFFLLVVFILGFVGLVAKTGCSHQSDMAWDMMLMLDGAYRLQYGQMPHVDYVSPFGIFPIWLVSLGMKIGGLNANALAYGGALGLVFFTLLAWFIAARRLSGFFAFSLSLLVGCLFVASRPLSFGLLYYFFEFSHASYAMWYNRVGWALLSILAIQAFLLPNVKEESRLVSDMEAFLAGCLVSLLALTKVNYLAAALGIIVVGFCVTQPGRRRIFWSLAGIACLPALLLTLTHFSARAWIDDILIMGRLTDPHMRSVRLGQLVLGNLSDVLLVGAVLLLFKPFCGGLNGAWKEGGFGRLAIICGACVSIGLVVLNLNMQVHEVPLFAVACAVILETALRAWTKGAVNKSGTELFRLWFAVGTGIYLFLVAGTMLNDAASVVYSWAVKNHMKYSVPASGILQSKSLGPELMPPKQGEPVEKENVLRDIAARRDFSLYMVGRVSFTPFQYAHLLNDGLALLKPHTTPESRVFCMDLVNPFPFALLLQYPKKEPVWWVYNDRIFPKAEVMFGDVTHVMRPKFGLDNNSGMIKEVYHAYLLENFDHVSASVLWDLYVRKSAPSSMRRSQILDSF